MAKLSFLHLSDIHFGNFIYNNQVTRLALRIKSALKDHDKKIDGIIVTGDIFYGKSDNRDKDCENALDFFNTLIEKLNKNIANNEITTKDFIFVPGNHDILREDKKYQQNSIYEHFLKEFYKDEFNNLFHHKYLFTIRVYKDKKIAVVGLNSCMLERETISQKELEWFDKFEFQDIDIKSIEKNEIIRQLKEFKKNEIEKKWDDYGEISLEQLEEAFEELKDKINAELSNYTIVTAFHHHFYPFPEIYGKYGDSSLIRNFTEVIDEFQRNNVKIILHGHKHTPILRPITTNKYLDDSKSIMYVFSAGSIGSKDVDNRSFQVVEVYSPDEVQIAKISRFEYNMEELQDVKEFKIPPSKKSNKMESIEILEELESEAKELYDKYISDIDEIDIISRSSRISINKIIRYIGDTITKFKNIHTELTKSPKIILLILVSVHYRVVVLDKIRKEKKGEKEHDDILNTIKNFIKTNIIDDEIYCKYLIDYLSSSNNDSLHTNYRNIMDRTEFVKKGYRKLSSYTTISIYFTDLFLTLSEYGDFYYKKEGIEHKINIKLKQNTFHQNLPPTTINLTSDIDKRSITIEFKSKNPTVHKIAVLIVKDFEDRINKIDESFKEIKLKLYYLRPSVITDGYEMENYNFEAYIPTLLPLLTGDNLYKQKEVFIRELIQNSLDTILLREKIDKSEFDKTIKIIFDKEKNPKNGKFRNYLKIIDNGMGMDIFKVERYFTSIGRSFYMSDEYKEFQEENKFSYKAISNFGIGFLSIFMVCKEVKVVTKSYNSDEPALEINIPNYEGCFFINKLNDKNTYGTEITLYEDERQLLKYENIINYMENTFLDFQLDIEIINNHLNYNKTIPAFNLKKKLDTELILFVPFEENDIKEISWNENIKNKNFINKYPFGIIVDFEKPKVLFDRRRFNNYFIKNLNVGIKLSSSKNKFLIYAPTVNYNFPSSYIQLDVAREEIKYYKNKDKPFLLEETFKKRIVFSLEKQVIEMVNNIKDNRKELSFIFIDNIYNFFKFNKCSNTILENLEKKLYSLKISFSHEKLNMKIIPYTSIEDDNNIYISNDLLTNSNKNKIKIKNYLKPMKKLTQVDRFFMYTEKLEKKLLSIFKDIKKLENEDVEFESKELLYDVLHRLLPKYRMEKIDVKYIFYNLISLHEYSFKKEYDNDEKYSFILIGKLTTFYYFISYIVKIEEVDSWQLEIDLNNLDIEKPF